MGLNLRFSNLTIFQAIKLCDTLWLDEASDNLKFVIWNKIECLLSTQLLVNTRAPLKAEIFGLGIYKLEPYDDAQRGLLRAVQYL